MNYRVCCWVLLLLPLIAWAEDSPNKRALVKQAIRPGTRYVTTSVDYYQTAKVNSAPTEATYAARKRAVFREDTSKPDADGFTTVTMTPLQIQSHREWPGRADCDFDYDSETTPADSPLGKTFQPLLQSRYIITIDPAGTFRNMIIKGNPWAKMRRASPESTRWMGAHHAFVFGVPTMTEVLTLPATYLPKHAVKQGDTWNLRRTSCLPQISCGTPFKARVKVSSITDDCVKFALTDVWMMRPIPGKKGVNGRPAGKIVFDRNTNTVTEFYLAALQRGHTMYPKTNTEERTRSHLKIRVTVSDKLTLLKPLPPLPAPIEEAPAKSPTTKPATP
jgi:hypothetical protein